MRNGLQEPEFSLIFEDSYVILLSSMEVCAVKATYALSRGGNWFIGNRAR
jgi:hypothetical protein